MNYLISLDWFQYCCKSHRHEELVYETTFRGKYLDSANRTWTYRVSEPEERHTGYLHSYTIYSLDGQSLVHLHFDPSIPGVPEDYCAAKVDNRLLYSSDWSFHLHNILAALDLEPHNITRADVCFDFQQFENGDLPADFIKKYVRDGYGKDFSCYIRKHSNKCHPVLTKFVHTNKQKTSYFLDADEAMKINNKAQAAGVNFNLQGIEQDEEIIKCESVWEYVRWGSRSSAVCVYMYDKSREMKQVKQKPWIRHQWEELGVCDMKDEQGQELPVYRIEISITSKALDFRKFQFIETKKTLNKDITEKLKWQNFAMQSELEDVFWSFAAEYFCFYEFKGQKHKKNMPVVQLFPQECLDSRTFKPVCISRSYDTGRMEKMAASTFDKMASTMLDLFPSERTALEVCAKTLRMIGAVKTALHQHSQTREVYVSTQQCLDDIAEVEEFMKQKIREAETMKPFKTLYSGKKAQQTDTQQVGGGQSAVNQEDKPLSYYEEIKAKVLNRISADDLRSYLNRPQLADCSSAPSPKTEFCPDDMPWSEAKPFDEYPF